MAQAQKGDVPAVVAELAAAGISLPDGLVEIAESLIGSGHFAEALDLSTLAVQRAPGHRNARLTQAEVHEHLEQFDAALAIYRQLHDEAPKEALARVIADLLVEHGVELDAVAVLEPYRASRDPATQLSYARACFAAGLDDRALPFFNDAVAFFDEERRLGRPSSYPLKVVEEVEAMRGQIIARLGGEEQVVVDAAARGKLDSRAGENLKLLAASEMVASEQLAVSIRLLSVPDQQALGDQLLEEGKTAAGLVQLGTVKLRLDEALAAEKLFDRALAAHPRHFGAQLGLAAARIEAQRNHRYRISKLPRRPVPPLLERVMADWSAFTDFEKRAVVAQVAPFAKQMPELVERGAILRVLPFDVRTIDVPEFDGAPDEMLEDDFRSNASLHGVCGDKLALVSLGDVVSFDPADGLTLAHEFAHLVHVGLSEETQREIRSLFERACHNEWAWAQYQLKNEQEFFACTYVEYLLLHHGLDLGRPADDAGELQHSIDFFERLLA